MTETLLIQQNNNGITILTFNRPHTLNALNLDTITAFQQAIDALSADDTLRVLIVTGAGEQAFCSGGDLTELSEHPTEADARHFINIMGDALHRMERLPVPVIAAINGYALGGGSEIALACDMRIADAKAKLGMVQIKMALTPGWGAGQRLLRLVGYPKAMALLLSGDVLNAESALNLGLLNQVVAAGSALQEALAFAEKIAQQPPAVVRGIKSLLQAGLNQPYEEALKTEREIFPALWADEAHLQAVQKFLERRKSSEN